MPDFPDVLTVAPLRSPLDATVRPPGSKSITNRALLCAALAPGTSTLTGALFADDTRAMLGAITALGATVDADPAAARAAAGCRRQRYGRDAAPPPAG